MDDPFRRYAELQKRMDDQLRPLNILLERVNAATPELSDALVKSARAINAVLSPLAEHIAGITAHFSKPEIAETLVLISRIGSECKALEKAGWLPHSTLSKEIFEMARKDAAELGCAVEKHYRNEWEEIKLELVRRVEGYKIDDEAKATFSEGLTAHEAGLYRSTVRLLFPEIERVARKELHNGAMKRITSQRELLEFASSLTPFEVEPKGYYGLSFYKKLVDHLYVDVNDDNSISTIANDAVPNRHAAVHGLVIYSSFQNSINSILMTDYVFQIIHIFKRQALG